MRIVQSKAIDVTDWRRDDEAYPEGARDKTLIYCSSSSSHSFLRSNHPYLFKRSSNRYSEQFWVEIFAYHLGMEMQIPVPPAFAAYDNKRNQSGALIEWFLDPLRDEIYISGGDCCQQYLPHFDRKKGTQHNFQTVSQIFGGLDKGDSNLNGYWKNYWAKILTFDALIGNTDRHQDNWGIIITPSRLTMRIAPAFDNGTAMGHEIFPNKFSHYENDQYIKKYVSKGWHHMKWSIEDAFPMGHLKMLQTFAGHYPETHQVMVNCLRSVNYDTFKNILGNLTALETPVQLTTERANFMLKLLQFRHQYLLHGLEK